jgi:hypothetical protein
MEQNITSSQILIFETLHEFTRFVDNALHLHKSELTKYEEDLGLMLRQDGQDGADAQWMKEMQDKLSASKKVQQPDEAKKDSDKKDDKKEAKDKEKEKKEEKHMKEKEDKKKKEDKSKISANWKNYNDLHIFSGNSMQGKTEVYFLAINELKAQVDKLKRIQDALAHLMNTGISNAFYLVYTRNGLPEKLVLLPQTKKDQDKFEFKADFITENVDMAIESSA